MRELEVSYNDFSEFVAGYIHSERHEQGEQYIDELNRLKEISLHNQRLWPDAKALILEWLAYYTHANKFPGCTIQWNIEKNKGEIDVLIEFPDYLKLIECKVNPDNCNLVYEVKKLLDKASKKGSEIGKRYVVEFWFWFVPSEQNKQILAKNDIKYTIVIDKSSSELLRNIDLSRIQSIMQIDFQ